MPARLSAFLIWALVAASAVFWGLRLAVRSPEAPGYTVAVGDAASVGVDLTRLFGSAPVAPVATAPAPEMASRFRLSGVMAPQQPGGEGVALIAIDGKLPRAFRVGAPIDGDLVLQSVSLRTAAIGPSQGKPAVVLELPPLPPAATGALPPPQMTLPQISTLQRPTAQLPTPQVPPQISQPQISPPQMAAPPIMSGPTTAMPTPNPMPNFVPATPLFEPPPPGKALPSTPIRTPTPTSNIPPSSMQ